MAKKLFFMATIAALLLASCTTVNKKCKKSAKNKKNLHLAPGFK